MAYCYKAEDEYKPKKQKKDKKHKRESMLEIDSIASSPNAELSIEEDEVEESSEKTKKSKKDKKEKRKESAVEVVAFDETVDVETPKKKKSKKEKKELDVDDSETHVVISTPVGSAHQVSSTNEDQTGGSTYWRRTDWDKYQNVVSGTKYADNSHYAKGGDSWGNDAADRLGKVRGQGFKKEMQKLKRASWKGCGSIDTGVNSVQFSDWDE